MEKVTESVRLRVHRAGRGALVTLGREALSPRLACEHRWPEGLAGGNISQDIYCQKKEFVAPAYL